MNNKKCTVNDCSEDWIQSKKNYIKERDLCVDSCLEDEIYQIWYNYKCFSSCPTGSHESMINKEKRCILNCENNDLSFVKDYQCIENCNAMDFFNVLCVISNENVETKEKMVNIISNEILNDMNTFSNQNLVISYENEIYQITTTELQNTNENNNETTINLGECENILKTIYEMDADDKIIIYKMDYFFDGFLIPITEYKLFSHSKNRELNLSYCQDHFIKIKIPVIINAELYKYNPFSEYYYNSCFPDTDTYSTNCEDTNILNERINEFNTNKMSLCETNCFYIDYDQSSKKVECFCLVKSFFIIRIN